MRSDVQAKKLLPGALVAVAVLLVAGGVLVASRGGDDRGREDAGTGMAGGGITVTDVWTGPNQGVTAVYLTIHNDGPDDVLVGAAADVAGGASLMGGGSDVSHSVEGATPVNLPIPSGTTELHPGGSHLMLEDLTRQLQAGDTFPLHLELQHAGDVQVEVEVVTWDEAAERSR